MKSVRTTQCSTSIATPAFHQMTTSIAWIGADQQPSVQLLRTEHQAMAMIPQVEFYNVLNKTT